MLILFNPSFKGRDCEHFSYEKEMYVCSFTLRSTSGRTCSEVKFAFGNNLLILNEITIAYN